MAYASTASSNPEIRVPLVAMPKLRWPQLSRRARALLMMGIMISPTFLADDIGYGVQRLFMTADQIAARQVPAGTMPTEVYVFHVACADTDMPAAQQGRWAAFAAQHGWPRYPQAGAGCFKPNRALFGVVGLKAFNVACPTMVLSVADQRRWVAYATNHGWTEYAQAGVGCVDP
jgi:hypothetical protein